MSDAVLKIAGDSKKAQEAIVALEKKVDILQNNLKAVSQNSRQAAKQFRQQFQQAEQDAKRLAQTTENLSQSQKKGLGGAVAMATRMASGYLTIAAAIGVVTKANRELQQEAQKTVRIYDQAFRAFQIQSGLTEIQAVPAKKQIADIAMRYAVPVPRAASAATQLVSSGFSPEEATGASLEAFLSVLSATGHGGKEYDPAELALSMTQFMAANKMDLTGENVLNIGKRIQALSATNLQLNHLTALAKESGAFRDYLSVEDQLATQSFLVEAFDPTTAATAIRNMSVRLASAGGDPRRVENLAKLGLNPEDVDFIGEDWTTILDRLAGGFETVPETQRASIMKKLFEEATIAPASFLLGGRSKLQEFAEIQQDDSGFELALNTATSGVNAADVRQQIRNEMTALKSGEGGPSYGEELQRQAYENDSYILGWMQRNLIYGVARGVGFSEDSSLKIAVSPIDLGFFINPKEAEIIGAVKHTVNQSFLPVDEQIASEMTPENLRQVAAGVEFFPQPQPPEGWRQDMDRLNNNLERLIEVDIENGKKLDEINEKTEKPTRMPRRKE